MDMFEKNSADPFGNGKKKHVVSESCWPIGNSKTNVLTRNHSATANQKKRGDGREKGKAMQPFSVVMAHDRRWCRDQHSHLFQKTSAVIDRRYRKEIQRRPNV